MYISVREWRLLRKQYLLPFIGKSGSAQNLA